MDSFIKSGPNAIKKMGIPCILKNQLPICELILELPSYVLVKILNYFLFIQYINSYALVICNHCTPSPGEQRGLFTWLFPAVTPHTELVKPWQSPQSDMFNVAQSSLHTKSLTIPTHCGDNAKEKTQHISSVIPRPTQGLGALVTNDSCITMLNTMVLVKKGLFPVRLAVSRVIHCFLFSILIQYL